MTMFKRALITSLVGLGDEDVLTTADVAAILQISTDKAVDLMGRGIIAGMWRVGTRMRITAGDLRKYRETMRVGLHRSPVGDLVERGRRRRAG